MSQKKKLVLGPLPEQKDDYSQYEESVTHWGRIIALLLIIVLIFSLVIFALLNEDEVDEIKHQALAENIQQEPALNTQVTHEVLEVAEETKGNVKKYDVAEINAEKQAADLPDTPKLETKNKATAIVEVRSTPSTKNSKKVDDKALVNNKLAVVSIENKAISRAVLTQEIKDKEPGSKLSYELVLPEEGIVKVILFNEIKNLRGKTLYHEWYRDGARQARVKIPVNVSQQRSHSSKYINAQMYGNWQVKVLDETSKTYVLAEFSVVKP